MGDVCHVSGGGRVWDLSWRRPLLVWEEEMLQNLLPVLVTTRGSAGVDSWRWSQGDNGEFSVESCYSLLERLCLLEDRGRQGVEVVFKYLRKCPAPSKVVVFSWTLLLDRIPTRLILLDGAVLARMLRPAVCFATREMRWLTICSYTVMRYLWFGLRFYVGCN